MAKSVVSSLLTPELSKAARRELSLTQNNVIAETGIQAYKIKQFEAGRFRPEVACLKQLREFYESHGVDFDVLEAHMGPQRAAGRDAGDEQPPVDHKRGLTATPRPGFFISEHLAQELIDRVLTRMEENDDRIAELVEAAYERGMFGGVSEATENKVRELFAAMAENHLLFRFLQGRNIIAAIREEPKTIGEFLGQWLQQSPAHDVFDAEQNEQPAKSATPRAKAAAQVPAEAEEE